MNWVDQTLSEISEDLGLESIQLDDQQRAAVVVDGDDVGIEVHPQGVVMYRISNAPVLDSSSWTEILKCNQFRNIAQHAIQIAVTRDLRPVASTHLPERDFSRVIFYEVLHELADRLQDMRTAAEK